MTLPFLYFNHYSLGMNIKTDSIQFCILKLYLKSNGTKPYIDENQIFVAWFNLVYIQNRKLQFNTELNRTQWLMPLNLTLTQLNFAQFDSS